MRIDINANMGFSQICQAYVALFAIFGFIFGQFYFSTFQVGSTMAGISGFIISFMGKKLAQDGLPGSIIVILVCILGLGGVGIDAFEYYSKHNIPGNDFGWFLIAPYCLAMLYLAFPALQKL